MTAAPTATRTPEATDQPAKGRVEVIYPDKQAVVDLRSAYQDFLNSFGMQDETPSVEEPTGEDRERILEERAEAERVHATLVELGKLRLPVNPTTIDQRGWQTLLEIGVDIAMGTDRMEIIRGFQAPGVFPRVRELLERAYDVQAPHKNYSKI